MREHIFKAKKIGSNEWVQGDLIQDKSQNKYYIAYGWIIDQDENKEFVCFDCDNLDEIDPNTICEYTGLNYKNNKMIFEGDIIQFNDYNYFDIQSIVKIGKYEQDASGGEYSRAECYGVYYEIDNFTRPDWAEEDAINPNPYENTGSLLSPWIVNGIKVIGNIYD